MPSSVKSFLLSSFVCHIYSVYTLFIIIIDTNNTPDDSRSSGTNNNKLWIRPWPAAVSPEKDNFYTEGKDTLKQVHIAARNEKIKGFYLCLFYRVWIVTKSILRCHKIQNKISKNPRNLPDIIFSVPEKRQSWFMIKTPDKNWQQRK